MNKNKLKFLCLFGLLASQTAFAATAILEDFSSGAINRTKFVDAGSSITLDTTNHDVILTSRARAFTKSGTRTRMRLVNTSATMIQAELSLDSASLGNSDNQLAFVALAGGYYNTQSAIPTEETGDLFIRLAFGDKGNGLEVWYWMSESLDDTGFNYDIVESGTLDTGPLEYNTGYTASITYDGSNGFVFIFNGVNSGTVQGPIRMGPAWYEQRRVDVGLDFGHDNSTADFNDSQVDDGSIASVVGHVDDVVDENGSVDDFSGSVINSAIWQQGEFSKKVEDEKIKIVAKSIDGSRKRINLNISKQEINFLGAETTLLSTSTQNDATRVMARLAGYWYNDTYDAESDGNGDEGEIWTSIQIERRNGIVRSTVSAWRPDVADGSTGEDVFWHRIGDNDGINTSFEMDTAYALSIEKTETSLIFRIDGDIVYTHVITTPIYPAKTIFKTVRAEVRDDTGEAHALFDDITTDYIPAAVMLNAENGNGEDVVFPDNVIVHENEIVTLTAVVSDPSTVAAYLWEQLSGVDVSAKGVTANKVVGSESTYSFTVPVGSDTQTLAFKVTVVDDAGVDTAQEFSMSVDNSASATLADVTPPPTTSGGGLFNPLILFMVWVLYLGGYRRRYFK